MDAELGRAGDWAEVLLVLLEAGERAPSLPEDTARVPLEVLTAFAEFPLKVKELIDMEVSRSNMGTYISQVLIPMEKVLQIRDGKKVSKERNFFPGYVLMEADLTGEIAHSIKNLPNVIGFLGAEKGGEPVPLRHFSGRPMNWATAIIEASCRVRVPWSIFQAASITRR